MTAQRTTPDAITYPPDLPISQRHDELLEVIAEHQVVIIAGETGSGKSTQIPKLCLELGRGVDGLIGHTQPRRIAARSIAERVASELNESVGQRVGYTVRFNDQVGAKTMIRLMTDGILLAEIQRDRLLGKYDTIIIDEAHERSLNIDFLLGYLRQLLPKRPDLKVIITSATIDTERFSQHFHDAPIVEVSGRTYPVEQRYRPLDPSEGVEPSELHRHEDAEVRDQPQAIVDAVRELQGEGEGDVLVFCSGEREIRDAAEALADAELRNTEVIPLYARLSSAEQQRVFQSHSGRRVVLATNVAETSLTVPGIRYVVDSGFARISRFNRRTKVQRLPIEEVSQASANQRAGRCGRLGPGICIRLYSEADFDARDAFTEPEIQRTSLASVILQMASIGLGDIERFPFVDPPDSRSIRDGIALLEELDAVHPGKEGTRKWLTPTGRKLARIPLDPRLARMILEADRNGCLQEVLIITAALSIQDPRERPRGPNQQAALELHNRFKDPSGDFIAYLHLWEYLSRERRERSSNQFRKMCRSEYLHYMRVREWSDVLSQLRRVARDLGLKVNHTAAEADQIHLSLLAGLLSQVAMKDPTGSEFRGARNAKLMIAPGSVFSRNSPKWIMAGELVETNRLWARVVAKIEPEWLEKVGDHLVKRTYADPWWDPERGSAVSTETVSLYGLPLVANRRLNWGRIDPVDARARLLLHALVRNEWDATHDFIEHNAEQIAVVVELENRHRRHDLLVDEAAQLAFFDRRVPGDITTRRQFDKWWKRTRRENPTLLDFAESDLIRPEAADLDDSGFPEVWHHGDIELDLSYAFDTGSAEDGTLVDVPVGVLHRLDPEPFEWNVPALRRELVTSLLRTLPRPLRKELVPIPTAVDDIFDQLDPASGGLVDALVTVLGSTRGLAVSRDDFDWSRVAHHLRPWFRAHDDDLVILAEGYDLEAVKALLDERVRAELGEQRHPIERDGLTDWTIGDLPRTITTTGLGVAVEAYPTLVDQSTAVGVRLVPTADEQAESMWEGTRRLLTLRLPSPHRALDRILGNEAKLALIVGPHGSVAAWGEDVATAAIDQLLLDAGGPAWTESGYRSIETAAKAGFGAALHSVAASGARIAVLVRDVERELADLHAPRYEVARNDIRRQLGALVYPDHLTGLGAERLDDLVRYLRAILIRIDRLREDPRRDAATLARIVPLERRSDQVAAAVGWSPELEDVIWGLQELRVSLFAQSIGTNGPVSEKRLKNALSALG